MSKENVEKILAGIRAAADDENIPDGMKVSVVVGLAIAQELQGIHHELAGIHKDLSDIADVHGNGPA